MAFPPLRFKKNALYLLDQRRLPLGEFWLACRDERRVHWAIRSMVVRGAPAIGIAGGYGLYLALAGFRGTKENFLKTLTKRAEFLKTARPTGVNLRNILDRIVIQMNGKARRTDTVERLKREVLAEARKAHAEDDKLCRAIGRFGSTLFPSGTSILTHCNAGGLATTGYGTALGVFYAMKAKGKKFSVYMDETRPLLQGARLTAWELSKSRIPATLICDNMAASLMRAGKISGVVVGADRIASNGDTANKIGTYNLAVLARAHGIPFYIAAPGTTFDFKIRTGSGIRIEQRPDDEVRQFFGKKSAPPRIRVENPAFDATPHSLITAFITEAGILRPPYVRSFRKLSKA